MMARYGMRALAEQARSERLACREQGLLRQLHLEVNTQELKEKAHSDAEMECWYIPWYTWR